MSVHSIGMAWKARLVPRASRAVVAWLFICCALIFAMVVLGGVTRLTHSGLSIVEWRPITGILPPFTETEWQQAFSDYQRYPEFTKLNSDMTLQGFKSIFWLEYLHRVLGRIIGVVFFVPFVFFLITGRVGRALVPKLITMFVLGGLQGLLGWYMVKSGLVDRPDVSQYRLSAHLGLAFLIYGYIFWVALGLLSPLRDRGDIPGIGGLRYMTWVLVALVFVTALSGGLVAGLDAGLAYNTFPLMGGRVIPEGMFSLQPVTRNLFENLITVQFDHRVLATLVFCVTLGLWVWSLRRQPPTRTKMAFHSMLVAALLQVALGISTLLLVVPIPLAAAHQAGALVLFTASLWVASELREY